MQEAHLQVHKHLAAAALFLNFTVPIQLSSSHLFSRLSSPSESSFEKEKQSWKSASYPCSWGGREMKHNPATTHGQPAGPPHTRSWAHGVTYCILYGTVSKGHCKNHRLPPQKRGISFRHPLKTQFLQELELSERSPPQHGGAYPDSTPRDPSGAADSQQSNSQRGFARAKVAFCLTSCK